MLIHIGYQKCGSTWLQRHLFPNGEAGFASLDPRGSVTTELITPHPLEFDPDKCRAAFEDEISAIVAQGKIPVLTGERLSGAGQTGGYDSKEMAERLAKTFPDAKVLIVIREQKNMIYSSYNQWLKGACTVTIREFIEPPTVPIIAPFFSKAWLRYHLLIQVYYRLFGPENVLVLPFERPTALSGEPTSPGRVDPSFERSHHDRRLA